MKSAGKKNLLKWNTILWLAAMVMPAIFHIALGPAKFPWPLIFPLLLFGPMLASNKMLARAIEEPAIPPLRRDPSPGISHRMRMTL